MVLHVKRSLVFTYCLIVFRNYKNFKEINISALDEALAYYSFDNDSSYRNYVISSRQAEKIVPSIHESTKRVISSGQAIADHFGKGVTLLSNDINAIAQQAERDRITLSRLCTSIDFFLLA